MYADFAKQGTVVALGSFDGLHLGHMAVINEAKNMATRLDAKPILCTFFEHPKKGLTGEAPPALFTGEVREQAFRDSGVEVVKLDFASIMDMSPEEFFGEILIKKFNAKGVCCGFNYTFGAKGAGDSELLEKFCREAGMGFSASPATMLDGEVISSSRIRHALEEGNVELAERMLGRPFHYCTRVIDGDKRGRTWGIPTINQKYETELVIPRFGVYLSRCTIDGKQYYGATNIGVRPTIKEGEAVSSETFILDYTGDLYTKFVDVALLRFLRPEQKFDSLDELEEQMKQDIATIQVLAQHDIHA